MLIGNLEQKQRYQMKDERSLYLKISQSFQDTVKETSDKFLTLCTPTNGSSAPYPK